MESMKSENCVAYFHQIGYSIIARYYMLYVVTHRRSCMRKLFRGKNKYSDEEFEDEDMLEEDELEEDEEDADDEDELEDDEDSDDDEEDSEEDDEEDSEDDEEDSEEDDEEDSEDDDEDSDDDEEDSEDDDEEDSEDDEEDSDDDEEDRRLYRRKRRIRNQIISYSVVAVILAAIVAGGVFAGKSIASVVREKKLAEEQVKLAEEQEAQAAHEVVIDAPEPIVEEEPEEDYLGKYVEDVLSDMTLEDKVAGLFIVTPEALTGVTTATQAGDGTQEALEKYAVGGLIYFEQNIIDKEQIMQMLSNTIAKSKYPIFLAVDEEGGSVSRVAKSGIDVVEVGDMAEIGASGDGVQAYEAGVNIGSYLKELGFNLDFAPVADVAGSEDSMIGARSFGADAQLVGEMVANAVGGIEGAGVSSCLKHFPGLGDMTEDTHDGRVATSKTLDEMRATDFIPFKAGIDAGADFVMVSHVTMSDVEGDAVPSSLSKTVMTDVLRNELGFQGVIITDALNMGAITEYYTSEEAVIMAVEAGADMLLMPDDFESAYNALLTAVQDGTISEERVDESLERIYRIKCAGKV